MSKLEPYSPWQLLPAPVPQTENPKLGYFYDKVAKHLIPTTVRIMNTGLPIDLEKVQELEKELDTVLLQVETTLASNPIVKRYLLERYSRIKQAYVEDRLSKCKTPEQLIKPFKHTDMNHRSYFMHCIGSTFKIPEQDDKLPTGIDKWPANKIKPLAKEQVVFKRLLAGELNESNNKFAKQAMELLATHKAEIYNKKYLHQAKTFEGVELPAFNPASPDQKNDILVDILGYQSEKLTDSYKDYERACTIAHRRNQPEPNPPKRKYSWDRDNIERIYHLATDEHEKSLLQSLIDHSMGAIVKNNFIKAFYSFTVDGRLYGSYKLLGAKSARYTSQSPNMLNMPSTGSIYAKPVKKCFIAPPGYRVWTIDYSSLEDRVLTSLTKDPGKLAIYEKHLDGHCYSSLGYHPTEIYKHIPNSGDLPTDALAYKAAVDAGNSELKSLRQASKPITFKLAYLGMPDADKGGVITQEIYDGYHKKIYPNIMKNVEDYILPTVKDKGRLHLGLGFYIKSDNPTKDVRTLNNSANQFWSILTALAINELHHRIDSQLVNTDDVQVTSTIYDSVYGIVKDDPRLIKWLNDNIVEIMIKDFMEDQVVKNEANLEIGSNWSNLQEIKNNATLQEVEDFLINVPL